MERTMTAQDLVLNLRAAGIDGDLLDEYLSCWRAGETAAQLKLLSKKRENLLDRVHRAEKQIDCLDYLVYQIRKGLVTG